jgi:transcription-repair coupling factor (superfamily II helicase)
MTFTVTGLSASAPPLDFKRLDWPGAEAALQSLLKKTPDTLIHGVPGSAKAFLLAWFYERLREPDPWLVLTPSREEALALQSDLLNWLPGVPVHLCPSWEVLPQDVETPDPELIGERQRTFFLLLQGGPGLVVSPLLGAFQRTMAPEE